MKRLLTILALSAAICAAPATDSHAENRMAGGTHISSMGKDINLTGEDLRQSDVLIVQKALHKEGYYTNVFSGQWNDDTTAALEDFQTEKGLEVTGTVTPETMKALDIQLRRLNRLNFKYMADPAQNYEVNK